MSQLHITLRFNDVLIEDKVINGLNGVRLGEAPDAAVKFPGANLSVRSGKNGVVIDGESWGATARLTYGEVTLELREVVFNPTEKDWSWMPDPVILVATVGLITAAAFADTLQQVGLSETVRTEQVQRARVSAQPGGYLQEEQADTGLA
ncbi:MAG: hypothetical protein GWP91_02930, partial [Rhodobacterales bacterium]|nr:hypothetical protein [Rhodobacterales bacterium]